MAPCGPADADARRCRTFTYPRWIVERRRRRVIASEAAQIQTPVRNPGLLRRFAHRKKQRCRVMSYLLVMAGLVPAIHVFLAAAL
jgi:hypothetical protein